METVKSITLFSDVLNPGITVTPGTVLLTGAYAFATLPYIDSYAFITASILSLKNPVDGYTLDTIKSELDVNGEYTVPVSGHVLGYNGIAWEYIESSAHRLQVDANIVQVASPATNAQITVTNASQSFLAANTARKYLLIQNKDSTGKIYVSFGSAATVANGVEIPAGGNYEPNYAMSSEIFIIGDIASNANVVIVSA